LTTLLHRFPVLAVLLIATVVRAETRGVSCKDLHHLTLPAAAIGLPTSGAEVTSASMHHAGEMAYCLVLGRIHPVDPAAEDVRFELNLPERWNGKALHFGGGTFDGYLPSADGRGNYFPFPDAINVLNAKFARNPEMQRNFAGDALKKVHDVAAELIARRYGHAAKRMYFIGGSTGGREALRMAQRYPADYDGVLAAYAAWDQVELDLQFMRTAQALYAPGGFLGSSQTRLIAKTVEKSCDAKDGLRDGIISDPSSCHVEIAALSCSDGRKHHGCLSTAQMHTLKTFATEQKTDGPLSNGVDSIPGYNALAGMDLGHAVGLLHFPLRNPVFLFNSFGYVIGDDVTRNFLSVGHHFDSRKFDVRTGGKWHDELLQQAREIDSTDANLQPFLAHGGKLILVHGTADAVIPTNSSVDYYQRLQARLGAGATEDFARLYLIPGLGHGMGKFDGGFDTIGTLDAWVDRGIAPKDMVVTDNHNGRTRPMCAWPAWPKYSGSGDVNRASSFMCVQPEQTAIATRAAQ
jgi:pimeloyl-ACP methyl ester carboxylesterase